MKLWFDKKKVIAKWYNSPWEYELNYDGRIRCRYSSWEETDWWSFLHYMEDEKIEKSIEDSEYIYVMSNIYKSTDDCSFKERGKEELRRLINDKRKERRDKGNYRYIP